MADIDGNEMKALDAVTVRIKLTRANADLPAILASYHTGIVPAGFTDFDKAVGTGPFKVKSLSRGSSRRLARNENYYKTGRPYLEEIETSSVPDPCACQCAVVGRAAHDRSTGREACRASPEIIDAVPFRSKSGYHTHMIMRVNEAPFDNPDVRMALKLLVDRQRTLDLVYNGFGDIGNDQPISPVYPFYCAKIPQPCVRSGGGEGTAEEGRPFEPKSRALLLRCQSRRRELASVYRETAAAGGVDVQVSRQPAQGYWNTIWMKRPFHTGSWNMRVTPGIFLSTAYQSDATWNETGWKRPDFDNLLIQASKTLDNAKRAELYCQLQAMISNEGGVIIPTFIDLLDGVSRKVKGPQAVSNGRHGWLAMGRGLGRRLTRIAFT
jgi:peptide/nickel transport system substrate-binding protein